MIKKNQVAKYTKTEAGGYTVSVAPFWNIFAPPTLKCP